MKLNRLFLGALLAGMAFTTACTDLEPEVGSDVMKDDYYQTESQFATLIANAYSQLAGEYGYLYREGYWGLQEYTSDEVCIPTRGTDWYDNGAPFAMMQHTWLENSREVNNGWSFAYGGVTKCNDVLNNVEIIKGENPDEWDEVTREGVAETKVLRAFYHLLAMDVYGNVTIDDNGVDKSKDGMKQYSREEVFNWIEKELLDNIDQLKRQPVYGKMTRSVAHMILAKLYLNAEVYTGTARWQDCADQCDSIINGGYGYGLNTDYFTTFKKDNTANQEIILPIVFDEVYAKGNMFHLITLHYAHQEVYGFTTQPWNGPCAYGAFYDMYDDNDARKAQWFVGPIVNSSGDTVRYSNPTLDNVPAIITKDITIMQDPTAANTFEGARFVKFEIEPGIEHHANSDFPIYRYADVLMMKAECLMRLNGGTATGEALDLVNQVRQRTGLADYTAATLNIDELLNERGREFAWEGHRRQDQIRFDDFTTRNWQFMSARTANRKIFPIPQWVKDANPGVYTQQPWQ